MSDHPSFNCLDQVFESTAANETTLAHQPLRLLLADDSGAGEAIIAGLLSRGLVVREGLQRSLIVRPGSMAEQWWD